jgi:hypothetical protein
MEEATKALTQAFSKKFTVKTVETVDRPSYIARCGSEMVRLLGVWLRNKANR